MTDGKKHVFIIGCKGIPASYGGFETFVDKLTALNSNRDIVYHVACMSDREERFVCNGADCFRVKVPDIGAAKAVYYDLAALSASLKYVRQHPEISRPIFYILACRIGPFISGLKKKIRAVGGLLFVNPDGNEWRRSKWSYPVRKYWKLSESLIVKYADLLICDSVSIRRYIKKEYRKHKPKTVFISYGTVNRKSALADQDPLFENWLRERGLAAGNYYLIVGRFVPENNYETMLREFMASGTTRKLAIITTENEKLKKQLERKLHYGADSRIVFAGTVYDTELLMKIREKAFAYIHGHEVGGTNPSLLEALGSTRLNLLYDVGFNREVGEDAALYWTKTPGSLSSLIAYAEKLPENEADAYGKAALERVRSAYSWELILGRYEELFLNKRRGENK
ncbi:MAG: DUF1972 domain-containing protein [Lachnospiraceae bacterium]|nr:DUF1972 domain-containing protein [Lachnospiraceae bacterium]